MSRTPGPFSLGLSSGVKNRLFQSLLRAIEPALERLLCLSSLNEIYQVAKDDPRDMEFVSKALDVMGVSYQLTDQCLKRIPESGPVIVVSNHPFGLIEALVLHEILRKQRTDVKILANFLLSRFKESKEHIICVNPFSTATSIRENLLPLRQAITWVNNGSLLSVFPAGVVSHFNWRERKITDPKWDLYVARMVKRTNAPVIPVFFEGSNSLLFQLCGLIHPLLRTTLLPREFFKARNKEIRLRVGKPIANEKLQAISSDKELIAYLRFRTYLLSSAKAPRRNRINLARLAKPSKKLAPVADPLPTAKLSAEIDAVPKEQILFEKGKYLVMHARGQQIPYVLQEIGRLREISFRKVGEGTGQSIDLDRFDNYYVHLFIWNRSTNEIVGAYRLIPTDSTLSKYGMRGLYTNTLFAYRKELLTQMGPSLELGRSFVRPEYQKRLDSLHLLWRGIGIYVTRHPRYKVLFGTVSISNEYESISRQLIISFLRANRYLPELARLIRPRNPLSGKSLHSMKIETQSVMVTDLKEVNELIAEVEAKHKSVPVLLRQYLRLGGKLMGFNIDRSFGNVLDGLIYVNLLDTDRPILERYLGKEGLESFLAYHGQSPKPDISQFNE